MQLPGLAQVQLQVTGHEYIALQNKPSKMGCRFCLTKTLQYGHSVIASLPIIATGCSLAIFIAKEKKKCIPGEGEKCLQR